MVDGSAYARLLYGAISPGIDLGDVALTKLVVDNYITDASQWLSRLELPVDLGEVGQFTPGEQGSRADGHRPGFRAMAIIGWPA